MVCYKNGKKPLLPKARGKKTTWLKCYN
jgi:hypothetical protein